MMSVRFGEFELHADQRRLLQRGGLVKLGSRAFDTLLVLIERRDRLVPKRELMDLVWPGLVVEENNLQVQVNTLRKIFGAKAISTIPGRGYRWTVVIDTDTASTGVETPNGSDDLPQPAGNLLPAVGPLIGRADDLAALSEALRTHRLVSVVGAGGIGKTRLAYAAGDTLRTEYPDGVWVVDLATVTTSDAVATAVAQVFNVKVEDAARTADAIALALSTRHLLLVLDNCEHLLEGVAALAPRLLAAGEHLTLLTTSQEALRLPFEHVERLAPLSLPTGPMLREARDSGAVQLFVARAQAAAHDFVLGDDTATAVCDICRRLDGIALALELAAARLPLLGLQRLRDGLDERFRMLSGGSRFALARHQTLLASVEWSHGLLADAERQVLWRLAVFVGTFSLEAAQTVAGDESADDWQVLDHLATLVDKSLVSIEPGETPRYRVLETIRAFALAKLAEVGETDAVLRRHARAILDVFERSDTEQWSVPAEVLLKRYLPDLENLRAAMDWAERQPTESVVQTALAGASAWVWIRIGQRREGLRRCEQALRRIGPDTPPLFEARLLGAWRFTAYPQIGPRERSASVRAIEIYRTLGDRIRLAAQLFLSGERLARSGDFDEAVRAIDEASAGCDGTWPIGLRRLAVGSRCFVLFMQGRHEEVHAEADSNLEAARDSGDAHFLHDVLNSLLLSATMLGRHSEAIAHGRELVALARRAGSNRNNVYQAVSNLSAVLTDSGQIDEAIELAREVVPELTRSGEEVLLHSLALLAFKRGRASDAARVLGRAAAMHDEHKTKIEPDQDRARKKLLESLQLHFQSQELESLLKEGAALSDERAAQIALRS